MHDQPRPGRADLPGVVEDAPRGRGGGLFQVGVGIDDGAGLAAKFHHAGNDPFGCGAQHAFPGLDRAGKDDMVDVGMADQRGPGLIAIAADDVHRPGRDAGPVAGFGQQEQAQGRLLGRFQDDGIADDDGAGDRARATGRGPFQGTIWAETPQGSCSV